MASSDPLANAIQSILGARPTPADHRALAAQLDARAEEQRRLADAARKGGRPKGTGGRFVRWIEGEGSTGQLHIAPALYQELGEPARLDPQRIGGRLEIRGARGSDGYAVNRPTGARGGMPRISIGRETAEALRLVEGRRAAEIRGGAIIVEPSP